MKLDFHSNYACVDQEMRGGLKLFPEIGDPSLNDWFPL